MKIENDLAILPSYDNLHSRISSVLRTDLDKHVIDYK